MTVREFLTHNGLSAYADAFEAQQVGLDGLGHLSDDDLRADFGMGPYLDRKRFKAAVAGLTGASMFGEAAPLSGATRFEAPTPAPLSGATRFEAPTPAPLSGATRFEPVGPTRVDAPSALPERLGSYRVLGLLGVGGMGTVVRARHTEEGWAQRQGGDVAIKLIHPQIASDATFRDRFFSEAELGRRVQHPGLVPTFDVIAEGAWLGTVMSLVIGEPLTTQVVPGGLPVSQVVTLLQPVAEALDYLHGQGIVHRDLKPANIMVRADGRPVVLDLGIAKDTQALENHTRTMTAMGTSAWMAPEQADAKHVDGAADRYAFGMIAYVLLSGRLPWEEGTSEARVLAAKLYGKLSSLEQVRSGLPGHVTAAVMKMVSLDAGGRYATCVAFVGALKDDGGAARVAAEAKAKPGAMLVFPLPEIGEGVVEGEIVRWLVNVGDTVATDQPLCEIMTDKATVEISSPKSGRVAKTHGSPGDVVKVHSPLVDIYVGGAAVIAHAAPAPAHAPVRTADIRRINLDFTVPSMGESVKSAIIDRWLKQPGDSIKLDEALVVLDSDKATAELGSPVAGVVEALLVAEGDEVAIGQVIARIAYAPTPAVVLQQQGFLVERLAAVGVVSVRPDAVLTPEGLRTLTAEVEAQESWHRAALALDVRAQKVGLSLATMGPWVRPYSAAALGQRKQQVEAQEALDRAAQELDASYARLGLDGRTWVRPITESAVQDARSDLKPFEALSAELEALCASCSAGLGWAPGLPLLTDVAGIASFRRIVTEQQGFKVAVDALRAGCTAKTTWAPPAPVFPMDAEKVGVLKDEVGRQIAWHVRVKGAGLGGVSPLPPYDEAAVVKYQQAGAAGGRQIVVIGTTVGLIALLGIGLMILVDRAAERERVAWAESDEAARLAKAEAAEAAEAQRVAQAQAAEAARVAAVKAAEDQRLAEAARAAAVVAEQELQQFVSPTLGIMKWIPAGTFLMGSPTSESGRSNDETQHSVTLTKGYWLMEHEVTQGAWQAVMGSNPSNFAACGPTCPVEQVSWDAAVAFARKASARDGVTYTLPTEAQWEFAARGGQATGQLTLYAGSNETEAVGWVDPNSGSTTHAVCGKARNGYGLCDMTGNVWEWTADRYGDYAGSAADPTGAATASNRVGRGGGWSLSARYARVADRNGDDPTNRSSDLGLRLARMSP